METLLESLVDVNNNVLYLTYIINVLAQNVTNPNLILLT